jgi:hypothetical protein
MSLEDGAKYCSYVFDAELILFDTNEDAQAFVNLVNSGGPMTKLAKLLPAGLPDFFDTIGRYTKTG